jgi:hypothetical protein
MKPSLAKIILASCFLLAACGHQPARVVFLDNQGAPVLICKYDAATDLVLSCHLKGRKALDRFANRHMR